MMYKFVDREEELQALERLYNAKGSALAVIYGRRRIGKTELIKRFIKGKPASIYYLATQNGIDEQLRELSVQFGIMANDKELASFGSPSFEALFSKIAAYSNSRKVIVAIDEFPNLAKLDSSVPSIFQKIWDVYLQGSNVLLVLSGSSTSAMHSEVLNYSAPLYGRASAIIKLMPLRFAHAISLMPSTLSFEEKAAVYMLLGGVPAYYVELDKYKISSFDDVLAALLDENSIFAHEPSLLLSEEVKNDRKYAGLLDLVANGVNKPGEIASKLHMEVNNLHRYTGILESLGLIEKEFPVTEEAIARSKKGAYYVKDNFIEAYFAVITRALRLEAGQRLEFAKNLLHTTLLPRRFELLAHEIVLELSRRGMLFPVSKVGRWWGKDKRNREGKNSIEIDIVALNESTDDILFGEAEWRNRKIDAGDYLRLKEKAKAVEWHNERRKEHYALFARSGFTEAMKRLAEEEKVMLFDMQAISRLFPS